MTPWIVARQAPLSSTISGVCSNLCPWSQRCYLTISSFAAPFFCFRSYPASRSFPMSWLFTSGGQSIGASASASVLLMNIQGWYPLGLTGLISLQSKGLSRVFLSITIKSINSSVHSLLYCPTLTSIQDSWKNHSFDYMDLCQQSDISVFNTLSRFVKSFIPRNKHLLISWLQSPTAVILETKKIKSVTVSTFPPSICHKVMGLDAMILDFWCWVLSQLFHPPLSPLWRGSLVSLCFLPLEWYHLYIWDC